MNFILERINSLTKYDKEYLISIIGITISWWTTVGGIIKNAFPVILIGFILFEISAFLEVSALQYKDKALNCKLVLAFSGVECLTILLGYLIKCLCFS